VAIVLALVSLTLLAVAASDWYSAAPPESEPAERGGCRGPVLLLAVSILVLIVWVGLFTDWTFGRH
jgi:hypothetical protein